MMWLPAPGCRLPAGRRRSRAAGSWQLAAGSWLFTALLLLLVPSAPAGAQGAPPAEAMAALRTGRYAEAIEAARAAVGAAPGDLIARRTLVRALLESARYDEAIAAAGAAEDPALANLLGEALRARGRVADAQRAFQRAAAAPGPERLTAEWKLAELMMARGQRDEAYARFDRFIDLYNQSSSLSAPELTAVGAAVEGLGARDPQLFRDALKAYDEAIAADPADPEPRLQLAELFLDRYNSPEAQATLAPVLAANPSHPRALLAMARAQEFDGSTGEAFALVRRALEVAPEYLPARVMLARLYLDHEDTGAAEAELQRALAVDPESPDALAVLAAIRFVLGDQPGYGRLRDRVLRVDPMRGAFFATVAEIAARYRRYAEAATLAAEGVRVDPHSWTAHGVRGLNELRVGRVEEARRSLEESFRGDPYNAWIKNTLDLLDTYPQYRVVRTPHFELVLHGDEAALLEPYVTEVAEEAYAALTARYGWRPERPVRLEIYPRHADFSVRTVGLAGLGALGVSFGDVLAMDSPRAREPGEMNWGSTLWHELAHTMALGLSNHRVPRWFTEGLSVLEERRARPGWGSETEPGFLSAYFGGELPPASRLNEGFIRPRTPAHVGLAYHMASLVVEWIEETRGFDAITRMLRAYGDGQSNERALGGALRLDPAGLDREFDAWLRRRHDPARLAELIAAERAARAALEQGRADDARRELERAAAILPGHADRTGSPLALLARLHGERGDDRAATEALTRLTAVNETAYPENLELARLLEAAGDHAGAAAALRRAIHIYPYDRAVHQRLAELYARTGDQQGAVRERRALVALDPVDRAEALYQLALALLEAGDREGARRETLNALEVAPSFERAQELLLRLREGGG